MGIQELIFLNFILLSPYSFPCTQILILLNLNLLASLCSGFLLTSANGNDGHISAKILGCLEEKT